MGDGDGGGGGNGGNGYWAMGNEELRRWNERMVMQECGRGAS